MFSENYREVEVIDASDLSIVDAFTLTENAGMIRDVGASDFR